MRGDGKKKETLFVYDDFFFLFLSSEGIAGDRSETIRAARRLRVKFDLFDVEDAREITTDETL